MHEWFAVHDGLAAAGRLPSLARVRKRVSTLELALLVACGAVSAILVGFVKLNLRIPGHVIVLAVLPMATGLSIAPRRLAGSVMSAGAFGMATLLSSARMASYGSGAITSLLLLGPLMDLAMIGARPGWRLYAGLVMAGAGANLLALGSRAAAKLLGLDFAGARPFDSWWMQAALTYTVAGIVAGLIGAASCFRIRSKASGATEAGR